MVDLRDACTMFFISAHVCVADLDSVMIPYVNNPCDETTHNSHGIHTHYNNVRYIEWITRVNGARCLTARHIHVHEHVVNDAWP